MVDGPKKVTPVSIFYIYAREDELLREQLERHLRLLRRQGLISEWHDRQILPGAEWAKEIDAHLDSASIILLLISSDFLASDYCYGVEMQRALERHNRGEARVIPIFLRPVDWKQAPFAHLQGLPRDGKAVTLWNNQDEAFADIVHQLRRLLDPTGMLVHSPAEKANRAFLLKGVRRQWIEGLLLNSLHHEVFIQLGLHEYPSAVANPWSLVVREMNLPEHSLPDGTAIHEVYDRADGQLLILGEPGAGKTTLLLQLAKELLTRTSEEKSHLMPVIFTLSSWAINRLPFAEWLVEELHEKYSIPRPIAQAWITHEQIIPLLDGLDEVAEDHRTACVTDINMYRRAHHLIPLMICCRKAEYDVLSSRVELHTAVTIQPLLLEGIDKYCEQIGEPVAALRQALHQEKSLQELASTPLMLNILVLAYREESFADLLHIASFEQLQQQIFDRYVERMLTRRGISALYTEKQTVRWLSWLAKQLQRREVTEFYPEYLHSHWLPTTTTRYIYNAITLLFAELLFGGPLGLLSGLLAGLLAGRLAGLLVGLLVGILAGLFFGLNEYAPAEVVYWRWSRVQNSALSLGLIGFIAGLLALLIYGWPIGLFFGPSIGLFAGLLNGLLTGLFTWLLGGLKDHQIGDAIRWEWTRILHSALLLPLTGLVVGFLGWLLFGLLFGLIVGIFGGLVAALAIGFFPSQSDPQEFSISDYFVGHTKRESIYLGLRAGLLAGLSTGLLSGLLVGLFAGLRVGLSTGLLVWLLVWWLIWLLSGLGAILHQQKLQIFFRCLGVLPRSYSRFLDYAAERVLLRRVDRGYIFIHRLLLEYFASLNP
jgi:TIR domain/NACHT domain